MVRAREALEREAIARRASVRVAALDVRARLKPAGLKAEALLHGERAARAIAGSAQGRWLELGVVAVALLAVGLAMAQGRARPRHNPGRRRAGSRTSFPSNHRKEINNGDNHEDHTAERYGDQSGRTPSENGRQAIG
jgi:hypothetical protein